MIGIDVESKDAHFMPHDDIKQMIMLDASTDFKAGFTFSGFALINIEKNTFHGEWNYVVRPQNIQR